MNDILNNVANKIDELEEVCKLRIGINEESLEVIPQILKQSLFEILYISEKDKKQANLKLSIGYTCQGLYFNNKKFLYYDDIIRYKKVALIYLNTSEDKDTIQKFIYFVNNIEKMIDLLTISYSKGYPEIPLYQIIMTNGDIQCKDLFESMQKYQDFFFSLSPMLRFYSGRIHSKIYEYIKGTGHHNEDDIKEMKHVFKYSLGEHFNNEIANFLALGKIDIFLQNLSEEEREEIKPKNEYQEKIFEMYAYNKLYLEQTLQINNISEDVILEKAMITNKKYQNKSGLFYTSRAKIEESALNIYKEFTGNNVQKYSVLQCNDQTQFEEINAFLYMAMKCEYHCLFLLLKLNELSLEVRRQFKEKFDEMADKESEKMKSCLICIFENPESDLFLFLSEKYPQVNSFDDSCDNIKKDENGQVILDYLIDSNEIEIVKSKGAGVGKTTYIIDNFTEKGLEYVGLPLGGEFKRKTIMRLLKELTIPSKKDMGLYINFSDTKQIRLFTHVIFSLLFQKYFILNEDIFCLDSKFKIKIEIPYSFYNFEEKFPLLKKFKSFELDIAKLPAYKFKVDDKNFKNNSGLINSNIQLVCNYLNAYKNKLLSQKNIYFKEVETSKDPLGLQSIEETL